MSSFINTLKKIAAHGAELERKAQLKRRARILVPHDTGGVTVGLGVGLTAGTVSAAAFGTLALANGAIVLGGAMVGVATYNAITGAHKEDEEWRKDTPDPHRGCIACNPHYDDPTHGPCEDCREEMLREEYLTSLAIDDAETTE